MSNKINGSVPGKNWKAMQEVVAEYKLSSKDDEATRVMWEKLLNLGFKIDTKNLH